ncbi:hypothetical protein ACLOJK_004156 [Asimina triloba]
MDHIQPESQSPPQSPQSANKELRVYIKRKRSEREIEHSTPLTHSQEPMLSPEPVPNSIQEALKNPEWRKAVGEEIRALEKNGTWIGQEMSWTNDLHLGIVPIVGEIL